LLEHLLGVNLGLDQALSLRSPTVAVGVTVPFGRPSAGTAGILLLVGLALLALDDAVAAPINLAAAPINLAAAPINLPGAATNVGLAKGMVAGNDVTDVKDLPAAENLAAAENVAAAKGVVAGHDATDVKD